MILDVQTILKTDGARIPVQVKLVVPEDYNDAQIRFLDNGSFAGTLENVGGILELNGVAEGSFLVDCGRCMKETEQCFQVPVKASFANGEVELSDPEAMIPFSGTQVDLGVAIWPDVFLALNIKYLCKPDCKGLCPICGTDLNEASCECEQDEIDPRLAGLADLLK